MELEERIYKQIIALTEKGNDVFENNLDLAIKYYEEALELIPNPKTDWEASTWIYSSIGDALFFKKDYSNAIEAFNKATICPNGIGNAFICLRLGECYFELSNLMKAKNNLLQAYMIEGEDIFATEDEKYRRIIEE